MRGELEEAGERDLLAAHVERCGECSAVVGELQWLLGTMRLPGGTGYEQELRRELGGLAYPGVAPDPAPLRDGPHAVAHDSPRPVGWLQRLKRWLSTGGGSTR